MSEMTEMHETETQRRELTFSDIMASINRGCTYTMFPLSAISRLTRALAAGDTAAALSEFLDISHVSDIDVSDLMRGLITLEHASREGDLHDQPVVFQRYDTDGVYRIAALGRANRLKHIPIGNSGMLFSLHKDILNNSWASDSINNYDETREAKALTERVVARTRLGVILDTMDDDLYNYICGYLSTHSGAVVNALENGWLKCKRFSLSNGVCFDGKSISATIKSSDDQIDFVLNNESLCPIPVSSTGLSEDERVFFTHAHLFV